MKSTREREAKQQKRNQMILAVFITIIMVGSTIGYFVGSNDDGNGGLEYKSENGETYTFEQINGKLYTSINDKSISFYSHPLDAKQINISEEAASLINTSRIIYLTFDPVNNKDIQFIEQARFDLENDFAGMNRYLLAAVTNNVSEYKNFQVITCANSSVYAPVVYFMNTNNTATRAYVNDSCIIFEGKRYDFLRFRDFIVYKYYGVI